MICPLHLVALLSLAAPSATEVTVRDAARTSGAASVGEWVTYRIEGGPGRGAFWRLAAVEEAKGTHGEDLLWLEVELGVDPNLTSPMAQMRMLVPRVLHLEREDVQRLIAGFGGQKPVELDPQSLKSTTRPAADAPIPPGVRIDTAGRAITVETRSGSVQASPFRLMRDGRILQVYWLSSAVPLLHLAKIEIPGLDQTLVIDSFGFDAKSKVSPEGANRLKNTIETPGKAPADSPPPEEVE